MEAVEFSSEIQHNYNNKFWKKPKSSNNYFSGRN
jgi:hypothetical protein